MNSPVDSHNRAFTIQSLLKHMPAKPEAVVLDFNPSPGWGGKRVMWLFVFNIVLLGHPGTHNENPHHHPATQTKNTHQLAIKPSTYDTLRDSFRFKPYHLYHQPALLAIVTMSSPKSE